MIDILKGLNEKQLEAVTHYNGPMLVIAGAGSGKTRALTHRIAHLISEKGISPWNVLAVTFTNKAANEMKERIMKLLAGDDVSTVLDSFGDLLSVGEVDKLYDHGIPTVGTFHSVCVRILRKNIHLLDYENSFAIYDYADQQVLVKRIMNSLQIDPKKINPKAVLSHISNAKNQLLGPSDYTGYASDYFSEKVSEIYPQYQDELKRSNALDFDDIIMKTVELFTKFPDVLDKYQEKFKYILVDEYQDTNKAQFILIKLLADKYKNICVIGDVDQSIYGWRGATIQNILDFERDYPDTRVVMLEQNYRSTQNILDASNQIISKNSNRKDKKLWTDKDGGEKIKHWISDNERHEGELIATEVMSLLEGSEYPEYKDFVVLYRTNAQSRVLEEVFLRYGIPYKLVGGTKFYERMEVRDILAYLKVIQNQNDTVSLLRIVNKPARKIGLKTLSVLRNFSVENGLSFFNAMLLSNDVPELSGSKAKAIDDFVKMIKELTEMSKSCSVSDIIKYTLEMSGYKKALNDGSVEGEARLENINELVSVAQKYNNLEAGRGLSIFLEEVSLISDLDTLEVTDNAVTFMTVHSAKGLEFPNVFVAGLEEGVFPHSRSLMDRNELEEERRLMYVAVTRAMERVYLLHTRTRMLYGEAKSNAPSQFLSDIDEALVDTNFGRHGAARVHIPLADIIQRPVPVEINRGIDIELSSGDRISHNSFGDGIVVNVTGGVATIAFTDAKVGVKKLALSVAPIKKI